MTTHLQRLQTKVTEKETLLHDAHEELSRLRTQLAEESEQKSVIMDVKKLLSIDTNEDKIRARMKDIQALINRLVEDVPVNMDDAKLALCNDKRGWCDPDYLAAVKKMKNAAKAYEMAVIDFKDIENEVRQHITDYLDVARHAGHETTLSDHFNMEMPNLYAKTNRDCSEIEISFSGYNAEGLN